MLTVLFTSLSLSSRQTKLIRSLLPLGKTLVGVAVLSTLMAGCIPLRLPTQLSEANLQMQVASTRAGTYTVNGTAELPNNTQLKVAAIRYLYPANVISDRLNPKPTYAILDYQSAKVTDGRWQTELKLWQPGKDGNLWESWQLHQTQLGLAFKPMERVVFLATLSPIDRLPQLEQQLAAQGLKLNNGIIYTTTEGARYAQIDRVLPISPPVNGNQTPTATADPNYGWGDRYLIPNEPPNPTRLERPTERPTTAPPTAAEFLY